MSDLPQLDLSADVLTLTRALVASHGHYDHFGGLIGFLEKHRAKLPAQLTLYAGGEDNFCNRKTASGAPGHFSDWGVLDRRDLDGDVDDAQLRELNGDIFGTGRLQEYDVSMSTRVSSRPTGSPSPVWTTRLR